MPTKDYKKRKNLKQYRVTRYFHTNERIIVKAASEEEALEKAKYMDTDNEQILNGLVSDGSSDVEEL